MTETMNTCKHCGKKYKGGTFKHLWAVHPDIMKSAQRKSTKTRMAAPKKEPKEPTVPLQPRTRVAAAAAAPVVAPVSGSHATCRANGSPLALRVRIGTSTFEISGVDQVDVL